MVYNSSRILHPSISSPNDGPGIEITENVISGPMPVFEDLKSHVVSPFVQLTDEFMDLE